MAMTDDELEKLIGVVDADYESLTATAEDRLRRQIYELRSDLQSLGNSSDNLLTQCWRKVDSQTTEAL